MLHPIQNKSHNGGNRVSKLNSFSHNQKGIHIFILLLIMEWVPVPVQPERKMYKCSFSIPLFEFVNAMFHGLSLCARFQIQFNSNSTFSGRIRLEFLTCYVLGKEKEH